jgi:LacI family transcriptional regulator
VTLKEIADETGFSIATISMALKGSGRISAITRQKVQDAAQRMNYVPNVDARNLALSKVQKRTGSTWNGPMEPKGIEGNISEGKRKGF